MRGGPGKIYVYHQQAAAALGFTIITSPRLSHGSPLHWSIFLKKHKNFHTALPLQVFNLEPFFGPEIL